MLNVSRTCRNHFYSSCADLFRVSMSLFQPLQDDRDRGEPRGPAPPPPPCVRVRTRRFGGGVMRRPAPEWQDRRRATITSISPPTHPGGAAEPSTAGRAIGSSVPRARPFGASPRTASPKASSSWLFCRSDPMSSPPFRLLPTVRAFAGPTRLLCPLLTSAARSPALANRPVPIARHPADLLR